MFRPDSPADVFFFDLKAELSSLEKATPHTDSRWPPRDSPCCKILTSRFQATRAHYLHHTIQPLFGQLPQVLEGEFERDCILSSVVAAIVLGRIGCTHLEILK
jgi:hypothetical protein